MTLVNGKNAMMPYPGKVVSIEDIGPDIKMIGVELMNGGTEAFSTCQPGQFAFVSAYGVGEAPFGVASSPNRGSTIEFAVQRLGTVTTALHEFVEGDYIGVRGPLGNHFPMGDFKDKEILVIGGGIGAAPMRPVLHSIFDARDEYGGLNILMASRNPSLHIFQNEYDDWQSQQRTEVHLIVDEPDDDWQHMVGLSTDLLKQVDPSSKNAVAITCGPPIMIFYINKMLDEMGFKPEQRYVTLEARMHCGVGKCGRCNIGEKFVCTDGPVFSMTQVDNFLESYL